jgi:membrane peptidoglycan carboxypeptidase
VYTNLDPKAQEVAEKTLAESIAHAPKGVSQAALVSVSVADGAVVSMVGGVGNFWKNQFNRAVNPHTVGSSFKPFVYLTAFLSGTTTPDSYIEDSPLVVHQGWGLPDYVPKNFDHKFYGRIPVRKALYLSRNIPALRIAQKVGIDKVIEIARLAGIKAKLDPNLSLALGSSAISPLEMAGAYSTFARGGIVTPPKVLRRVENSRGQMLVVSGDERARAFPPEPVAALVDVLQDVVKCGTGTQAKLADRPVAGKTGTADAGKDIWFIGFTPDLVTAVWGGNDEDLPIPGHNVTGGVVMAKIWRAYTEAYYKVYPTPPGAFPMIDYKSALQKSFDLRTKEENENNANKVAESKSKSDTPGSVETILAQPKVEEIDTAKESLPMENIENPEAAIQPSSMPPTAPKIVHKLLPAPDEISTPSGTTTLPEPAPAPSVTPAPQRLVPARLAPPPLIEQTAPATDNKRLYPYSQ